MTTDIESIKQAFFMELEQNKTIDDLLRFKGAYLGKQGHISSLLAQIKEVKPEERGTFGQAVNQLKKEATIAFQKESRTRTGEIKLRQSGSQHARYRMSNWKFAPFDSNHRTSH